MLKTNRAYFALVIIVLFGLWLLKPSEEPATVDDFSHLVRINPVPETQQLVQQEKFAEADIVATSAALITAGTAATAKPAVSFLKMATKAGKMPKWLGKSLVESAEIAKKTKSLDHLTGIFSDIHGLYKTAGARSTLELLGKSNNLDDFRRLAKFGSTFGGKTSTLLKIVGDDAVCALKMSYHQIHNYN